MTDILSRDTVALWMFLGGIKGVEFTRSRLTPDELNTKPHEVAYNWLKRIAFEDTAYKRFQGLPGYLHLDFAGLEATCADVAPHQGSHDNQGEFRTQLAAQREAVVELQIFVSSQRGPAVEAALAFGNRVAHRSTVRFDRNVYGAVRRFDRNGLNVVSTQGVERVEIVLEHRRWAFGPTGKAQETQTRTGVRAAADGYAPR